MNLPPDSRIRVLVVDDSPFMRLTIQKILGQDSGIKVIDTARDGREAIEKLKVLRPQVVTMDIEMPVMNGLQALNEIMRCRPTPVIVFSSLTTAGAESTLKALDSGAFDVVAKPSGPDLKNLSRELCEKIHSAAKVNLTRLGRKIGPGSPAPIGLAPKYLTKNLSPERISLNHPKHPVQIVAIGTSTGGPSALQTVLPRLPADFPVPVVVAQHMPPGFTGPLAQRLNGICPLTVCEASPGEILRAGKIYIAPAGKQMQVERKAGQLVLQIGDNSPVPTHYHPAVDVMLLSLAKEVGKGTLAVIMTGMGNDGLRGMKEIKASEGYAIAEAEETCVVYGMPKALVDAGLADRVVPLGNIARVIRESVQRR
ncbi:MAG TPA: chemotaxis response regulator protein-glutamate methylesterase [Desulfitobacteriaceae bacterium]|nr:chemotaxis response regulator protein-glutamate methylesterase [Desulfitobacteriaceae bacterium]